MFGGLEIGFFGIIWLLLVVWAGFHIVQSSTSPFGKAIWVIVVLFIPVLGWLIWLLFGPRAAK